MSDDILSVSDLVTLYRTEKKEVKAIRNLNLGVRRGETIALVGESGSGKSTLGLSILRLIEPPNEITEGSIVFRDSDGDVSILELSLPEIRSFRWKKISMIFQSAMNVLDPVMRIQDQFIETFEAHSIKGNYGEKINHFLELAGLGSNVRRMYPHELSGGMKQRVCIALALSCEPELLIADEPTTALDVVVQKEVLLELNKLKRNLNLSIIFITHDLSLAYVLSKRVVVMYAGRIMENGISEQLVKKPLHPYTAGLLMSVPSRSKNDGPLFSISGSPPSFFGLPKGCTFHPRCPQVFGVCREKEPSLTVSGESMVRCWLYE